MGSRDILSRRKAANTPPTIAATRAPGMVAPRPAFRAQLTPIVGISPFEEDAPATKNAQGDNVSPDVITKKLVLRPNVGISEGETDLTQVQQQAQLRKQSLLADMTCKLQEILKKLGEKNIDEQGREKYQALAQSIQAQMA